MSWHSNYGQWPKRWKTLKLLPAGGLDEEKRKRRHLHPNMFSGLFAAYGGWSLREFKALLQISSWGQPMQVVLGPLIMVILINMRLLEHSMYTRQPMLGCSKGLSTFHFTPLQFLPQILPQRFSLQDEALALHNGSSLSLSCVSVTQVGFPFQLNV